MAWVQLFPTNNTLISQSVQQIQDNWLFIQNNINTDHYFNTGAPNEGHHQFVHLPTQGADPAVLLTGVVYQKLNGAGVPRLYYRSSDGPEQIATCVNFSVVLPAGLGPHVIYDFAAHNNSAGFIMIKSSTAPATRVGAFYNHSPALFVDEMYRNGAITSIQITGTAITINKTNPGDTFGVWLLKMEL